MLAVVASVLGLCSRPSANDNLMAELDSKANQAMSSYDMTGLDSLASLLLALAKQQGNKAYQGKAHFYLSAAATGLPASEVARRVAHLDTAEQIAEAAHNDTLLCYVYNQRGVWEMVANHNVTAQYWFTRSLDIAHRLSDRKFAIPAESNMSEACRREGDTLSIVYDKRLLDYALQRGDSLLTFASALHCASYYARTATDTAQLRPYIDAMKPMSKTYPDIAEYVYAQYYFNKGDYATAERYLKAKPLAYSDQILLYARVLNRLRRYHDSEQCLGSVKMDLADFSLRERGTLLSLRASNMHGMGNDREAYARQLDYEAYRDSLDRARILDLTKRYQMEYRVSEKDRQISEQRLRLRNMAITISAIVAIVAIVAVFLIVGYRRRRRYYQNIVRQNRDFLERQQLLTEQLKRHSAPPAEPAPAPVEEANPRARGISDERADEIYARITQLTDVEQVWRDVNITRDTFADLCGCNRTYLTQVLKAKTGMTYSHFMNACRVREAVRLLSNPDCDTPLKEMYDQLGFLTMRNFYAVFKQEIGMSPAAYRDTAREMTARSTETSN